MQAIQECHCAWSAKSMMETGLTNYCYHEYLGNHAASPPRMGSEPLWNDRHTSGPGLGIGNFVITNSISNAISHPLHHRCSTCQDTTTDTLKNDSLWSRYDGGDALKKWNTYTALPDEHWIHLTMDQLGDDRIWLRFYGSCGWSRYHLLRLFKRTSDRKGNEKWQIYSSSLQGSKTYGFVIIAFLTSKTRQSERRRKIWGKGRLWAWLSSMPARKGNPMIAAGCSR